jgi:hypothetical protein
MENKEIYDELYEDLQNFKDGTEYKEDKISENIFRSLSINDNTKLLQPANNLTSFINEFNFLRKYKDIYQIYNDYINNDIIKQALDDDSDNNEYIKKIKAFNIEIPRLILKKLKKVLLLKDLDDNINKIKTNIRFISEGESENFTFESDADPEKIYTKETFVSYLNKTVLVKLQEYYAKYKKEFDNDIKSLNTDAILNLIKDLPPFYSYIITDGKKKKTFYEKVVKTIETQQKKLKNKLSGINYDDETTEDEKTAVDFNGLWGSMFKLILYYFTLASIVLLFSVVVLSLISFFQLIYEIIYNIILLFVNTQSTKGSSIDYLSKNIIKCTKDDLSYDNCYIFYVQKQNLSLLNICTYIIYLLLIYILIFFLVKLYAQFTKQKFIGSINSIDTAGTFLPIIGIVFIYASVHFFMYKYIFKTFVYIPYKRIDEKERATDDLIANYILVYKEDSEDPLIDNNFFEIIYDLTRIDELNTIFKDGIESKNADNCLEQKIIIYDIYMYLREYVAFDNNMKENFKDYCTSIYDNKPNYYNTTNKITFLSLLNNNEVKMIKKYHEELAFYTSISDNNLEFYNNLNKSINKKIRDINTQIITHNKTIIPFFTTIFYIVLILIYNLIIFYIILNFVLMDKNNSNQFNYQFVKAADFIKTKFYDKIINYFI